MNYFLIAVCGIVVICAAVGMINNHIECIRMRRKLREGGIKACVEDLKRRGKIK